MMESNLKDKRVKLIRMEDPYTKLKNGDMGTIKGEDDMGHILVQWDNGSTLSLIPDIDEYKIEESKVEKFFEFILNENDLEYVKVKIQELTDLFRDEYHVGVWVYVQGDVVKFQIGLDDDTFIFHIDLEKMMLYKSFSYGQEGQPEDVHKHEEWAFENIDEAFDILEKEIYKILRISESNVSKKRRWK